MSSDRQTRGQILIVAAAAMVVLIGIGAIVMDLGMSWMLRRQEQNAADPGAVAAAQWVPTGNQAQMNAEACFYAQQNGFFVGDANCAAALASGDLDVNSPPTTAMSGDFRGRPGYVEVIIRDTHPSFFGQFFGRPVGEVATAAVAALHLGPSNTSSLVSLGESCSPPDDGDSTVTGGGTLTIHPASGVTAPGGFVNVNASCGNVGNPQVCDGNGNSSALAITGGATLIAPHFFVVGGCGTGGGGSLSCYATSPCLDEQTIPMGDPLAGLSEPWPYLQGSLPVPLCPDPTEINSPTDDRPCNLTGQGGNATCPTGTCTMNPGVYYAGWDIGSNVAVVMKPGMYVFAGGGIRMNAGSSLTSIGDFDGGGNPIGARVTIFSTDHTPGCEAGQANFCEGPIRVNSSGPLDMKATNATTCRQVSPVICPWKGILLWQDGSVVGTPQEVVINGQSDLILAGTIYGPESKVTINGGNSSTGCTGTPQLCLAIQIIARQWVIAGGAVIDMPYEPSELYQLPQRGLVH
jgi:hypothetical protein